MYDLMNFLKVITPCNQCPDQKIEQNPSSTLYPVPGHYLSKVTLTKVTSNIID